MTDTGEGIPADMQPHMFEPFFTTKDPSKGTGLGLSIVYGIAKEAGGTVSFATAPNKGTTFEVLVAAGRAGLRPWRQPSLDLAAVPPAPPQVSGSWDSSVFR